jgi:Xaa-Pro aminopeptidase
MGRHDQLTLTTADRAELHAAQVAALRAAGFDAFLAVGSADIVYLSGVMFPYLDQQMVHPVALFQDLRHGRRAILCTPDLAGIPAACGWEGEVLVHELGEPTPEAALVRACAGVLAGAGGIARVGIDGSHMPVSMHRALAAALPDLAFASGSAALAALRAVKTPAEVRVLEATARIGDRGVISALNHAEGAAMDALSFPMWEFGERLRVHVGEFEGSGMGNLSILQGERARKLYSQTGTRETFRPGELLRLEYSCHNHGYWITGSRTVHNDLAGPEARAAYADNLRLRAVALDLLRPGVRACDIHAAVAEAAGRLGIAFVASGDIGCGVGTAEREAPFLAPHDSTPLQAGMVLTLGVYTLGPGGEMICNRDIYAITEAAPRLLSWYKDWDRLYCLHGTSARHG